METPSFQHLRKARAQQLTPTAQRQRSFTNCPRCQSRLQKTKAYNNNDSEFWLECSNPKCNTYVNTYIPQPHQSALHSDPHCFKGNFGGYGSGKTLTDREEFYKHLFISANGNGLIGANITTQYEGTIKRDIENDFPRAFITDINTQKSYIDFINGYRLMFRPFDDADKLRSLNLDFFLILEASEVKSEAYVQLKSRIRNLAATLQAKDETGKLLFRHSKEGVPIPIIAHDWRQGIVESNPDSGWIKTDLLLKSDDIRIYGDIKDSYYINKEERDPAQVSFIVKSDLNQFLPPNFLANLKRNKPLWWVARYIEGSFLYSEGLVYPSAQNHVVPTFEVPRHWKRIIAHDYGLVDPSVFLFGAIDEHKGKLYIYREVRTSEKNTRELAAIFKKACADIPIGALLCTPLIDPKSGGKRDYDKVTLLDHYAEYGLIFQPGVVSVDARIFKTNTYLESGNLEIMDCCVDLIAEIRSYKFQASTKGTIAELTDKPVDRNNHSINCLEWIVMELPASPFEITYGIYNKKGLDVSRPNQDSFKPYNPFAPDYGKSANAGDDNDKAYGINFGGLL